MFDLRKKNILFTIKNIRIETRKEGKKKEKQKNLAYEFLQK